MSDQQTPEKKNPPPKRLTRPQWIRAEQMWASGDYTLQDLMKSFNVSKTALVRHFKKHEIKKGQDAEKHRKAIQAQLETRSVQAAEEAQNLIAQVKENNLKWSETLQKRIMLTVAQAMKDQKALATVKDDIKTLKEALQGIKLGYDIQASILHLDKEELNDDELPILEIVEMTADQVEEMRRVQAQEEADMMGEPALLESGLQGEAEDAEFSEDDDVIEEG